MCFNALDAISDISFSLHGNFSDTIFLGGDINMRTFGSQTKAGDRVK